MQLAKKRPIFIRTLTLCAMLFLIPLTTVAQPVSIPDANLRKVINETLGNRAPNAPITVEDMRALRELRIENRDIQNLKGLEAATHLEFLWINGNSISDLSPLAGLIKLRDVNIRRNNISDISPLSGLISLRWLDVSANQIVDISPVERLTNLRGISVSENNVTDLSPLASLIRLEWVEVSENPFADLTPLSGLINLKDFKSWGTLILNLGALAELPKLWRIDICGGELSDISALGRITDLRDLYLAGNAISDISALANLKKLTRLNLKHNEVSDLSPLVGLKGLTWIDLRDNNISDVSPLETVDNLTWVDLADNRITDVSALSSLQRLTWMSLGGNTITDVSTLERFSATTSILYSDVVSAPMPPAGPKIEGPWLWAVVPGGSVGDTDLLSEASGGAATEVKVSTFGAKKGKAVGDKKWSEWTAHTLLPTSNNNIDEMAADLGWDIRGAGYRHVVYGCVTLNAPRKQDTIMLVGSNDGVKVWLNGEEVYYNPVIRWADDYQDAFPVTLKQGDNVLLVAIDNRHNDGGFSGFFGFAEDADYTVNPLDKEIEIEVPAYDVNEDGITDIFDLILVGQDLGDENAANARTDVNGDGKRDIRDLVLVASHLGNLSGIAAAPTMFAIGNMGLDPAMIRAWIAQAEIEDDGSLAFEQGIATLQQLLALLVPERTALLPNYPNPFNPETWIPYQLAESAEVRLRIYAMNGALVRTLDIGHRAAGSYQDRSRAAYWDGKNGAGEPVASGVYFYTLTVGDFKATRKMIIRK